MANGEPEGTEPAKWGRANGKCREWTDVADQAEEGGGFGLFLLLGELTHLADPSINVHG